MKSLRRIAINIMSGGAGYLVPMAVNVLTVPYVLAQLGKEAYGLQVLANVIIGYLIVGDMGLDIPVTQKIAEYDAQKNSVQQSKFLLATFKIYVLIGLFGFGILLLCANLFVNWLAIPSHLTNEATTVFYLSGLGFFGSIISMWGKAVFNGLHRYELANGVQIFNNLFGIGVGLLLIHLGYGIVGFFSARVAGLLLSAMIYFFLADKRIIRFILTPFVDIDVWNILKRQIGYGFSLRLSGMVFSRMDQTLIGAWVSMSAVAVYSFPFLLASTLSGLIASLTHFAFPMISALNASQSRQEMESFFMRISKFIVALATMLYIPFIVFGDRFVSLWINPGVAQEGHWVLVMLMIAFYVNACLNIGLNAFIVGIGELRYFTIYSIVRSVVMFIGFILFIKIYSMEGAGIAYLISLIIDAFFVVHAFRKKLGVGIGRLFNVVYFRPVLIGAILGCALYFFRTAINTWLELIIASGAFVTLYFVLAYIVGVVDQSEKKLLKSFLQRMNVLKK
jgi:O-antigen/teichoic acid export membrane protein